jgi:hypothetical protein
LAGLGRARRGLARQGEVRMRVGEDAAGLV